MTPNTTPSGMWCTDARKANVFGEESVKWTLAGLFGTGTCRGNMNAIEGV